MMTSHRSNSTLKDVHQEWNVGLRRAQSEMLALMVVHMQFTEVFKLKNSLFTPHSSKPLLWVRDFSLDLLQTFEPELVKRVGLKISSCYCARRKAILSTNSFESYATVELHQLRVALCSARVFSFCCTFDCIFNAGVQLMRNLSEYTDFCPMVLYPTSFPRFGQCRASHFPEK